MIRFEMREVPAPCHIWGEGHEETALGQLEDARWLPVTVGVAGMADLHTGYGLPIGGVLATKGCVIPYAVGMDAYCRMRMTVLNLEPKKLYGGTNQDVLKAAINKNTSFGLGAKFSPRKDHEVMYDGDWYHIPFLRQYRDLAWEQLGTSGSGNHFVELGIFTVHKFDTTWTGDWVEWADDHKFVALLSHSGSRGVGNKVCQHYSKIAEENIVGMPDSLKRLSWLDLAGAEGQEYWRVMELMGKYAAASHKLIHEDIVKALGCGALFSVENHHNFACQEKWNDENVIVHRKGATPAGKGVLGMIPGTRETPGYLVLGKGEPTSFNSASHGAGRAMSRTATKKRYSWQDAESLLMQNGVTLISGGLDEISLGYKDIHKVMAAQTDLVEVVGEFKPVLVKMAPEGEKPED